MKKRYFVFLISQLLLGFVYGQKIHNLKITILSTMLADTSGKGEWGFSALVEADGRKLLFDAGADSSLVMDNAKVCGIDLSKVPVLVLSHSHDDHTGGWHVLRNGFSKINPNAFDTSIVGKGFFITRYNNDNSYAYSRRPDSLRYIQEGGHIVVVDHFTEIYPGIYLTGPVPRKFIEKNYQKDSHILAGNNYVEDSIPEDMSLIFDTNKGWVMLSGCGHSGIINTLSYLQKNLKGHLYAAIGGFHLFNADENKIRWTAAYLKKSGMKYFMGAHCTGINAVYEIRSLCGLKRNEAVVGAVGAYFDLDKGIMPGWLAQ